MGWIANPNPSPGQPYHTYGPSPDNIYDWAPIAWFFIAVTILYIVGCWMMYQHTKLYNRNVVCWTATAIVFTPVLAWIAYGLSWPKSQ